MLLTIFVKIKYILRVLVKGSKIGIVRQLVPFDNWHAEATEESSEENSFKIRNISIFKVIFFS